MLPVPAGRILLAFSGGPDSLGLAARLRSLELLLAYVDHRLRGHRESRRERLAVREAARRLDLPLVRCCVSVAGAGEAAARRERWRALAALARKHDCVAIATAHTADDRAETILLNLERGTGLRGLAAPLPRAVIGGIARIKPALDERRAFLRRAGLPFRPSVEDKSNRVTARGRGRVRALRLPALERLLGEDPVPLLCALADAAARPRGDLECRAKEMAGRAGRRRLLAEEEAAFPYLVEALRGAGPPLTAKAYEALRAFLRAGRRGRSHVTPGGEAWRLEGRDGVRISGP